jgi:SAM-dependent methyltransferase
MQKFRLPADYVERPEPAYFDDSLYFDSEIVHQPEVYEAASFFARAPGRTTIIDIGCGNGRKLRGVQAARHVGVDFGANISFCRRHFPSWGEWIDADLSRPDCIKIAGLVENSCVVVCADVIEHMVDPEPLVALLAECHRRGAIVVTSTPDRARVHGAGHNGPPSNKSHVREWALAEYDAYLADRGLPSIFAGYTLNNNIARELKTIITIHDVAIAPSPVGAMELAPLAILSAYNEADVIGEVCEDLLDQGCDVVAIDNW